MMKKDKIKKKGKGFIKEFKEFISRGNAMNLAIGVIIGGAFQKIINSLVDDIMMPLLGVILNGIDFSTWGYKFVNPLNPDEVLVTIMYGKFISAVVNFLLMALIIFLLVKIINKVMSFGRKEKAEEPEAPTTKKCPYCKSEIDIDAVKCPHCTSDVE